MTSVLTDEERIAIRQATKSKTTGAWSDSLAYSSAIEAATIKRLAAGVSVEPVGEVDIYTTRSLELPLGVKICTLDQLTTAIAAARVQENERCVQACAAKSKEYLARSNRDQHSHGAGLGAAICAELLSALLGKEAQS